jgi:hypothetical protein
MEEAQSRGNRSVNVVTKSLASTPFGKKLIYKINGECIWSEYVSFSPVSSQPHMASLRTRAGRMLGKLRRRFRSALLLKAV